MTEIKQPPITWRGKSIDELPIDILHKLKATLKHHGDRRSATNESMHPGKFKRTKKLKIDFKTSENGYFNQLSAAVTMALARKKQ